MLLVSGGCFAQSIALERLCRPVIRDSSVSGPADLPKLPTVAGGWAERTVPVGGQQVRIAVPADPDAILDDAATIEQNQADDYMPYWCWLWPAAIQMAAAVSNIPLPKARGLEVGAGLGLAGISGLLSGHDIVISDYREEAVQSAQHNAALNGFPDADVRCIDWREQPTERYEYLLACDVLYETSEHQHLLRFADAALRDHGECWIGDPGRMQVEAFVDAAQDRFRVRMVDGDVNEMRKSSSHSFFLLHLTRK